MAAVYEAFTFLNEHLKLGLDSETLSRVEMMFKERWLETKGYAVDTKRVDEWEFFAFLEPRAAKSAGPGPGQGGFK